MEIDTGSSWHVAAASPVLLNDLIMQAADSKTEEAGIAVWETLMAKIGLAEKAAKAAASHPDDGKAVRSLGGAESLLGGALGKFFALSENYPDLKANTTMNQLMEELSSTENRVAFARQAFNDAVMEYNTYREQFPNSLVAGNRFQAAELLEIEDQEARKGVKVSFN